MQYALFPFRSIRNAGGADIREMLRQRRSDSRRSGGQFDRLELLDHVVELLRDLPQDIRVDHCCEDDGELRLAVTAVDLGGDVVKGDRLTPAST